MLPEVYFVLIGPFAKIDTTKLPRSKNIFYLGKKDYTSLPDYLKAFDIAMMPFALNKATEFISPTKTLEYMAALKPIISTPIKDVVRDYKEVVSIFTGPEEMKNVIQKYLAETKTEKDEREKKQETIIKNNTWEKTTREMKKILDNTL
jgi:glycosyltransferase involved in cell wall biosynthesis